MKFNLSHISQYLNDPVRQFQLSFLQKQAAVLSGSIFIARSALSLEQIGQLEWLFYLGYAGTFFWSNGLLQASLRSEPAESQSQKRRTLWNVFRAKSLFAGIWALIMLAVYPFLMNDLQAGFIIYVYFLIWIAGTTLSAYLPFLFYRVHQYRRLMWYNILFFSIYVVVFITFMQSGTRPESLLQALGIFGILLIAGTTLSAISVKVVDQNNSFVTGTILPALPLMGYALMAGLAVVTDGWLVKHWSDDDDIFAIFRYGARELPLSLAASVALSAAAVPLISGSVEKGLKQLKIRALSWMHILFPVSIALVLSSTYLFDWVYAGRFSDSVILFDVMLLLVVSRLIFPQSVLMAKGEYKLIFKISVLEIILNVGVSLYLLYFFGLVGIVMGTVIAFYFEKLLMIIIIYRRYQIKLSSYHSMVWHSLYAILLFTAVMCKYITIYL